MKPCADVPPQLWLSDGGIVHSGNPHGTGKMAWTPELVALCEQLRAEGKNWQAVAAVLADETGVELKPKAVQDYVLGKRLENAL